MVFLASINSILRENDKTEPLNHILDIYIFFINIETNGAVPRNILAKCVCFVGF